MYRRSGMMLLISEAGLLREFRIMETVTILQHGARGLLASGLVLCRSPGEARPIRQNASKDEIAEELGKA